MSQTVNGQKNTASKNEKSEKGVQQRQYRPGQRQQERLQRLERRRRRQRIITSSVAATFLIIAGIVIYAQYQRVTAQQLANVQATGTAVAKKHANATATAQTISANATATFLTSNCFLSSTGKPVPDIYAASATPSAGPTNAPGLSGTPVTQKDGLKYVDIKVGKGAAVKKGSKATVEYTGWLESSCKKFDSSYDRGGQAFDVTVGEGQVIKGWDEGLIGMKPGGIRRLYIPAALGYGAQANQGIPANSVLIFDVTMVGVK